MIMSFQEALNCSNDELKTVLLGNGFSIAANEIFHYPNLFNKANLDNNLRNIFQEMKTFDFEIVINKIENASKLLRAYSSEYLNLINELDSASEKLRISFAEAISLHHSSHHQIFSQRSGLNVKQRHCKNFLANFKQIFTTNYDLLLYWSILLNHRNDDGMPHDDGFCRFSSDSDIVWHSNYKTRKQTIFFLHGSLFFYQQADGSLIKMEKNGDLLSSIKIRIKKHSELPLIVLEGSSINKISKIMEHPYLNDALNHLGELSGSLYIYGHSLNETDNHIFEKIKESHVTQIFISIFDGKNQEDDIISRAHSLFDYPKRNRIINLFDAVSANVWI